MNSAVQNIAYADLSLCFIPVTIVIFVLYRWSLHPGKSVYALLRMVGQLLLVGYLLVYIFRAENPWIIVLVLCVMVLVSSWIALRTVQKQRPQFYLKAVVAVLVGGGLTLWLVSQAVLSLNPWYLPNYLVPLAGMIFAGVMNSVSLAAERLIAEVERGVGYSHARGVAMNAAMIPITNSLFAVGLVALPGMMTGQILSGVSPLVAVNYQIMVMLMIFGGAGIASASFLILVKSNVHPALKL